VSVNKNDALTWKAKGQSWDVAASTSKVAARFPKIPVAVVAVGNFHVAMPRELATFRYFVGQSTTKKFKAKVDWVKGEQMDLANRASFPLRITTSNGKIHLLL